MKDYKARYQAIKQRGEELKLNLQDFMTRKTFLYFKNNYSANFSSIPLEDYLNIVKSDLDIGGERLYPLLSLAISEIGALPDDNPHKEIGYRLITQLEARDTNKEKTHPINYFPLELCYLFNPLGETLEETLARYINSFFKPKGLTKKALIELIKQDFNIYAFLFNTYFYGGYILNDKPLEFEELISLYTNKLTYSIRHYENDIEQIKTFSYNLMNDKGESGILTPETKKFISNILDNIPKEIPPYNLFEPYTNEETRFKINYLYINLSFIISNIKTIKELEESKQDLLTFFKTPILSSYKEHYNIIYKGVSTPKVKVSPSTIFKENTPIEETSKIPVSNNIIDLTRSLQLSSKDITEEEYKNATQKYNNLAQITAQLEEELSSLKEQLYIEQKENGYNTATAKDLQLKIQEAILTIDKNKEELKQSGAEGKPFDYYQIGEYYKKLNTPLAHSLQITPTDSLIILNERTKLFCSNSTLTQLNNKWILPILMFLLRYAVKQLNNEIVIFNNEIEQEILGDRYSTASEKDKNNARNIIFIPVLTLLQATTIIYTKNGKALIPNNRRQASIVYDFDTLSNPNKIIINKRFYEEAIKDFPDAPLSKNLYRLTPRAKATAYYFHELYFLSNSDKGREEDKRKVISIRTLSTLAQYSNNLKYLTPSGNTKAKPERFYTPILEDLEEMREKGIIKNYTPTLKQYLDRTIKLDLNYMITLFFIEKPLKRKKKKEQYSKR